VSSQHVDVVGAAEARAILGVELQRISRWRKQGRLPPPYAMLASSPIWLTEDIEKFKANAGDPTFSVTYTTPPKPQTLLGTSEVAKLLGVDKSQVGRWRTKPPRKGLPFPEPVAQIKAGPIWAKEDIDQFEASRHSSTEGAQE
jgi:predicted DNA-binding transcriptional regulator AlpA